MNIRSFRAVTFALSITAFVPAALAQHLQIRTYGTGEGLPQSEVFALLQDRLGHLWFGTYESGLARYDGKNMIPIAGLPHPSIRCLLQDRKGHIWIGTEDGLACMFEDEILCTFREQDGLPANVVNSVAQDSAGTLWVATSAGVALWHGSFPGTAAAAADPFQKVFPTGQDSARMVAQALAVSVQNQIWLGTSTGLYFLSATQSAEMSFELKMEADVRALLPASDGALWVGTATGLHRLKDGQTRAFKNAEGLRDEEIFCLAQDARDNLWIGTRTCLMKYDGRHFTAYDTRHGLPNAYVRALLVDYEDNLWLGTVGGGVGKIYGWYLNNYTRENGLPVNFVFSFMQDRQGRTWIGTNGGGIAIVDGENLSLLNSRNVLPNDVIRGMVTTPSGDIWVATLGGAARLRAGTWQVFTTQDGMSTTRLRHAYCAPDGDLWFASINGAIHYKDGRFTNLTMTEGLPSNSVHQVHQDRQGRVWLGCDGGLVLRHAGAQKVFTMAEGLPDENIYAIFEDHAGEMWFGTRAGGVARFTGNGFENIDTRHGLPNNVVYFIVEDAQQRLWFGTNSGVACYDGEKFFYLSSANGLPNDECNTRAAMLDREGYLWFGTVGGATRVETALLPATSPAPRVVCEGIEVIGEKNYALPFSPGVIPVDGYNSTLILQFAALSFINEDEVKIQAFLEGFDDRWVDVADARNIRYTNLSPKRYTFHVRGSNALGIPSRGAAKMQFEILPPFYRTFWFIGFSLAAIAGLVYGGHWWRMRNLQRHAQELATAVAEKTAELRQTSSFLSTVKEFLPLGLLVVDSRRVIVEANREAEKLFEFGPEELKGLDLNNVLSSPLASRDSLWKTLRQKKSGIELVGMARGGKHFICEIHSDDVNLADGRLQYLILTCENIGERKELEAKVIDNEKQLALYDLAAGMGDVLTQKLANVHGVIDLIKKDLQAHPKPEASQLLGGADAAVQDLRKVMSQLFEFTAYLGKVSTVSRDLLEELRDLAARWKNKVTILLPSMEHPVTVRMLPKLKNGLDEGVQNALDAEATEVRIELELLSSLSRVRLTLTDNGKGVSPENVTKVFLPFFKTKDGHHTGLGLWKLHQVVKQSGGTVDIVAMPGGGTQLRLTLPLDPRREAADMRMPVSSVR
ncbi:MAG: two-component regulator propeller domain-containing protein [bacterium]